MPTPKSGKFVKSESCWPTWTENVMFAYFLGIILFFIIIFLGVRIAKEFKEGLIIGWPVPKQNTITVTGTGKIKATPDIATIRIGFVNEGENVGEAQKINTETVNKLIASLKKLGVSDEDIQTADYNIWPIYNYEGKRELTGYEIRQSLNVKIRNLDNISQIISIAGANGANEISNIQFTIDDPQELENQARTKALESAEKSAIVVSQAAGRYLSSMITFTDQVVPQTGPYYDSYAGVGGGGAISPDIEKGQLEIVVNATVTYEIR